LEAANDFAAIANRLSRLFQLISPLYPADKYPEQLTTREIDTYILNKKDE
jgi:hypothetical protein